MSCWQDWLFYDGGQHKGVKENGNKDEQGIGGGEHKDEQGNGHHMRLLISLHHLSLPHNLQWQVGHNVL